MAASTSGTTCRTTGRYTTLWGTTWDELAKAYEPIDPAAVLPIHQRLVENTLANTGAAYYRDAARRLAGMLRLAAGTEHADEVDSFITQLRETHRRRP